MRFSERQGHRSARTALQTDGIDTALRNSLWNVVQTVVWDSHESTTGYTYTKHSNLYNLIRAYWRDFYKAPIDSIPEFIGKTIETVRKFFFECEWFEVYDFIEFTSRSLGRSRPKLIELCNEVLEREMSGYRLAGDQIVPITSQEELDAIDESLSATTGNVGASTHLRRALELLSDRQSPDYRNSIKESISAVESVAQAITGNPSATLGEALKSISQAAPMHPALNRSLSALYGYTSDSSGIRHALLDEPDLDFSDAKFMLVACAAFVTFLTGKAASSGQS